MFFKCIYFPLCQYPCKSLGRKCPLRILFCCCVWKPQPWLSIVHLDFLVVLREFIGSLVSGRGGGLWESPVSLGGRGDTRRPGLGAPSLGLINALHADELLQGLWRDFLKRFHVRFHLLQVPFEFGPSVLKPGDDLRVGEPKLLRDLVAIGRREVFLVQKALLQFVNLVVCEGRPRLSPLFWRLPLSESV